MLVSSSKFELCCMLCQEILHRVPLVSCVSLGYVVR